MRMCAGWLICTGLSTALTVGCTQRNWYEGVQQSHVQQCNQVPESEREGCFEQHDDSYQEYTQKRSEIGK